MIEPVLVAEFNWEQFNQLRKWEKHWKAWSISLTDIRVGAAGSIWARPRNKVDRLAN
jgi:hypothetical protein